VGSRASSDFVEPVKELLMARIVSEIEKRSWTQVQAAGFLGISQPRVSDLVRGLSGKFTLDSLVQLIGVLDIELRIDTESGGVRKSLYSWLDESEKSIPYFTRLIVASPGNAEAYRQRAFAYHQRGQYDLAVGDYARAMELDAGLQNLRIERARSLICLGQFAAALLDCDALIAQSQDPSTISWAFITRSSVQQSLGDTKAALEEFGKAISVAPESPDAYFHRGCLYESLRKWKSAVEDFSKVLSLDANHVEANEHCQQVRILRGDKADD